MSLGQHVFVAGTRLLFGALTGGLRLMRGSPPTGWRTLRYGLHRDEILDLRVADTTVAHRRPVVFFHGGGWMMGTKDFYSHDLAFFGGAGFPVFNVEYPKAPEHPHPALLRSVLKALAFVRTDGADEVHVMGDSAGGNLAVMAAVLAHNPHLIAAVDPDFDAARLPRIISATSLYGVLDRRTCLDTIMPAGKTMLEAYGGRAVLADTVDDAHAITPMDLTFTHHPPCFLGCGNKDVILPSTELYARHLVDAGHTATTKIYDGATHGYFNFPDGDVKKQSQQDLVAFLSEVERR